MSDMDRYWREFLQSKGPLCLSHVAWKEVEPTLSKTTVAVVRHVMEGLDRQTRWVVEQRAALESETKHILAIGEAVRRAGLRSYIDDKGRIFIAGDGT